MSTTANDHTTGTVRLHRVIRCTPERLYRAFLDADALAKWLPPHGFTGKVTIVKDYVAGLRRRSQEMFVPLVHVTLEGESLPAQARTFVIGTPSPSGRVHPILLDAPPGGIAGLVAQAVSLPPASAAA